MPRRHAVDGMGDRHPTFMEVGGPIRAKRDTTAENMNIYGADHIYGRHHIYGRRVAVLPTFVSTRRTIRIEGGLRMRNDRTYPDLGRRVTRRGLQGDNWRPKQDQC